MQEEYQKYRESGQMDPHCALCGEREVVKTFTHWKIIVNDFPYDQIAQTHHMIIPIAHVTEEDIPPEAWQEFKDIKRDYIQLYDIIIESTSRMKSIPQHYHLHLILERES